MQGCTESVKVMIWDYIRTYGRVEELRRDTSKRNAQLCLWKKCNCLPSSSEDKACLRNKRYHSLQHVYRNLDFCLLTTSKE